MKNINKYISFFFSLLTGIILVSCAEESPFVQGNEETSEVTFSMSLNETLTRSVSSDESAGLYKNVIFQISDDKGLLFNWKGYENIPSNGVALKYGEYLASAEAGDSVAASFDKKFFRGATKFAVSQNQIKTSVSVICKIANVVVNVNADDIEDKFKDNIEVEFYTKDGSLTYNKDNFSAPGYFMRSFDKETSKYDDEINYKVTGIDKDNQPFEKAGVIKGVQPAYGYTLNIQSYEKEETTGGLTLRLQIEEYALGADDEVVLEGHPEFQWEESTILKNGQISGTEETFEDQTLVIAAYSDLKSLFLESNNETLVDYFNGNLPIDLTIASPAVQRELESLGIIYSKSYAGTSENKTYIKYSLTLEADWLKSLPVSQEEYVLKLTATDKRDYINSTRIRIANSASAIAAPFEILEEYWVKDYLSVRANSAEVKVNVLEGAQEVENAQLQYRKVGENDWLSVPIMDKTKGEKIIKLTNLETNTYPAEGVTYECRIVGGDIVEDGDSQDYQIRTKEIKTFTTETIFLIPNAGMENWILSKKVWEPALNSDHDFWDTGNHGSTTLGENYNLTTQNTEIFHTGTSSASLASRYVVMKIGAGNLFTGEFAGTSGSGIIKMDGMIDLGKPYNNSHPTGVKVWVNYRPQTANSQGGKTGYIENGQLDQGQIYIALASDIHRADTSKESTLVRTDNLPDAFIAFNEHTFIGNYGEDGELKEVVIPFYYFEKAKTVKANYLVIVCSASKYGDYYSGADGSTMIVDDFELLYDDLD